MTARKPIISIVLIILSIALVVYISKYNIVFPAGAIAFGVSSRTDVRILYWILPVVWMFLPLILLESDPMPDRYMDRLLYGLRYVGFLLLSRVIFIFPAVIILRGYTNLLPSFDADTLQASFNGALLINPIHDVPLAALVIIFTSVLAALLAQYAVLRYLDNAKYKMPLSAFFVSTIIIQQILISLTSPLYICMGMVLHLILIEVYLLVLERYKRRTIPL